MIEFLWFAMHEDPITLGLMIVMFFAVVVGLPVWLIVHSQGNHEKRHQFHSELMCDHCRARNDAAATVGEAHTRWPMRVMGDRPPRGTG